MTAACARGLPPYNRTLLTTEGDPLSLLTYDEWMQNLAARGVNIIVLQWSGKNKVGATDLEPPPWGTYNIWHSVLDPNNLAVYRADQVTHPVAPATLTASNAYKLVQAAEKHGVGLWICFTTFWEFWRSSYWKYHAWNENNHYINGVRCQVPDRGFLEFPRELLTNETAILAAKKRIKFVMDTFGDSDAVAMWEVMGEACFMVNYKFWGLPAYDAPTVMDNIRTKAVPWLEEMMQFIRDNDPRSRPVTISQPRIPPVEWSDNPQDYHNMATELVRAASTDFISYHDYISDGDLGEAARILRLLEEKFPSRIIGNGAYWPFDKGPSQAGPVNEPPPHLNSREMQWLYTCGQRCGFALRQEGFEERAINDWIRGGYADTDLQDVAGVTAAFCERVRWEEWSPQAAAWDEYITADANLCVSSGDGAHVSMMLRWDGPGLKNVTVHGLYDGDYVLMLFDWVTGELEETRSLAASEGDVYFVYDVQSVRSTMIGCIVPPAAEVVVAATPPPPLSVGSGAAQYQIWLRDWNGDRIAIFTGTGRETGGLLRFSFLKTLRKPGQYIIEIDGSDERIESFVLDYQVEFWRQDQFGGLDWYKVFEAFHRADSYRQAETGQDIYSSRGQHYNVLLLAEPIFYSAGTAYTTKSGPAETVAKEYVNENIGPGATSPPRDYVGVMPGLTIEADGATGASWSGGRSRQNLLDVLVELAEYAPADFMIEGTGAATFEFRWRANQWGDDKTWGNAASIPAVVFDGQLGNARNVLYDYSRQNEINVCHVLGQGSGEERRIVTRASGAGEDSPWNQRAVCRDARNTYSTDALNRKGDEVLDKMRSRIVTQVDVAQTEATRFGRDWDIGDLVTVRYRAFEVTQKIVGVRVDVAQDGTETIQAIMEEP